MNDEIVKYVITSDHAVYKVVFDSMSVVITNDETGAHICTMGYSNAADLLVQEFIPFKNE